MLSAVITVKLAIVLNTAPRIIWPEYPSATLNGIRTADCNPALSVHITISVNFI